VSSSICVIGVDLGGQSVKLGVVRADGRVFLSRRLVVDATLPAGSIARLICDGVSCLLSEARVEGFEPVAVGMAVPGTMDRDRTRLELAVNLPTLSGSDFLSEVRRRLPLPVTFDADSNAAALAEFRFGAGGDVSRLIVVAVGTGIGAGVVVDGSVVRVRGHTAGSLGHVVVDAQGPRCRCGGRGCVEVLASGSAMERRAAELVVEESSSQLAILKAERGRLTGVEIGLALKEGDEVAGRLVAECGRWLGVAIATWSVIYEPEKVLIGGGIAGLGEPFLAAVRSGFQEVGQPAIVARTAIVWAALGADAGMIGAGAMVLPVK